jgi:hypothetical protein
MNAIDRLKTAQQAKLKAGIVKQLCEPLKTDPRLSGQLGRFYTSA